MVRRIRTSNNCDNGVMKEGGEGKGLYSGKKKKGKVIIEEKGKGRRC